MKHTHIVILALLTSGQLAAQEAAAAPQPVFQVLSESTVQQRDGGSITFQKVVPPVVASQAQPAAEVPALVLTAAQEAELSQLSAKVPRVLSISATVQPNGVTSLRWTCGESQRLQGVSTVDFRCLAGVINLETEQNSYFLIISAGEADHAMTEAEAVAVQSLPANGEASVALLNGNGVLTENDEAALDAMEELLEYFDAHREQLVQQRAQREAARVARELAALNAPPPLPRHNVVQFWPLQPAQREAIQAKAQQEVQRATNGGLQP